MLRIAVCDDIPVFVEELAKYIEMWAKVRQIDVRIQKFSSGEDVLFEQEEEGDFAAIFMDIELSGINGMEAAVRIREKNNLVSVVFVSQYEQYFKQAVQIYPSQYVEKPIYRQKIFEVLDQIMKEQKSVYETFTFRYNRAYINITLGEVLYFVSEKRRVRVLMENGEKYVFYERLNEVEREVTGANSFFCRIHQSYLINGRLVKEFHPGYVIMRNNDRLPISRFRRDKVRDFRMSMFG